MLKISHLCIDIVKNFSYNTPESVFSGVNIMKNMEIIKSYVLIADFIAKVNGEKCEVILHDLSDIEHSIIYIVNSHISGRQVGGSITKYALDLVMKHDDAKQDHYVNYIGKNEKSGKLMRSSTLFIRNELKETIGLLCVNIDITDVVKLRDELNSMIRFNLEIYDDKPSEPERFDLSIDEIVTEIVDSVLLDSNVNIMNSTQSERKDLVYKMHNRGVFKFKGAVNHVSSRLDVSPQTLYRYIKEFDSK